jgi:hypothetical protein
MNAVRLETTDMAGGELHLSPYNDNDGDSATLVETREKQRDCDHGPT